MSPTFVYTRQEKQKCLQLPEDVTQELAYLCGVFAGDGSLGYRPKKYEYSLKCVGNPRDEKTFYHDILAPTFKEIFGFQPRVGYFDSGTTYGFRVFSKSLVLYLSKWFGLPLGRKGTGLRVPSFFLADPNLMCMFVRGVFDTDGCISLKKGDYPVISISSRSPGFIEQISGFLKSLGFCFYEVYDYKVKDVRFRLGYNLISRIEISGKQNLTKWLMEIGCSNPKHLSKIRKIARGGFEPPTPGL
jgi:hypothetical protein